MPAHTESNEGKGELAVIELMFETGRERACVHTGLSD